MGWRKAESFPFWEPVSRFEGETVELTVRGISSTGAVAEGQFSIYVKPIAKWTVAEIVRVPVISWGNSSKGSFVAIFEVTAQR